MAGPELIRFPWSFRSPYAWLAVHRIESALEGLPVRLVWIPAYPPDDPALFPNNPTNNPSKIPYIARDVARFADAYRLPLKWPEKIDTDWPRPHSAFLHAEAEGRGPQFAREGFAARFSRGQDLASDEVLTEVAERVDLDPDAVLAAADDTTLHARVTKGIEEGFRNDGIFGVPTFIYRGEPFWGNDRIEWLVRAIQRG